jgi:hypothetical protein
MRTFARRKRRRQHQPPPRPAVTVTPGRDDPSMPRSVPTTGTPAWQRAFVRWQDFAVYTGDLLSDVQTVTRNARVFGVHSTEQSLRSVAHRALEIGDDETREVAAQLLAELDKMPKPRRAGR